MRIGNGESDLETVDIGVPQGSVLGPLLFIIFINDIHKLPLKGSISLFADDTGIFCSNMSYSLNVEHLNYDLQLLDDFFRIKKISLNVGKTKVMHFMKENRSEIPDCMLNGEVVEAVSVYKYLGLLIDDKLRWEAHITNLCKKLSSVSGVLSKLKHLLPKSVLLKIYFSLAHSRVNYLIGIWGHASKKLLHQVQIMQKRCLKHVCKLPQRHSTFSLFNTHCNGILNVDSLLRLNVCTFVHNALRNECHHTVEFKKTKHKFPTRNRTLLINKRTVTKLGGNAMTVYGSRMYNMLPKRFFVMKACLFKQKLKEWLSERQYPGLPV